MDDMRTPTAPPPAGPDWIVEELERRHAGGASLQGMARAAGLHPNTLNRLGMIDPETREPTWRPRLDTLVKLHNWLSCDVPVTGRKWYLSRDPDGWYIVTQRGPFTTVIEASDEANRLEIAADRALPTDLAD